MIPSEAVLYTKIYISFANYIITILSGGYQHFSGGGGGGSEK